jgi:hypothetical protein
MGTDRGRRPHRVAGADDVGVVERAQALIDAQPVDLVDGKAASRRELRLKIERSRTRPRLRPADGALIEAFRSSSRSPGPVGTEPIERDISTIRVSRHVHRADTASAFGSSAAAWPLPAVAEPNGAPPAHRTSHPSRRMRAD